MDPGASKLFVKVRLVLWMLLISPLHVVSATQPDIKHANKITVLQTTKLLGGGAFTCLHREQSSGSLKEKEYIKLF